MFVPMWIVWAVGLIVVAPVLYFVLMFLAIVVSLGMEARRNPAHARPLGMEHARWPEGDPRGQPPVIASPPTGEVLSRSAPATGREAAN